MFIVYMIQNESNTTYPGIEGIFKYKDNALRFAKEKQHTNPDKKVVISQVVDDSIYSSKYY